MTDRAVCKKFMEGRCKGKCSYYHPSGHAKSNSKNKDSYDKQKTKTNKKQHPNKGNKLKPKREKREELIYESVEESDTDSPIIYTDSITGEILTEEEAFDPNRKAGDPSRKSLLNSTIVPPTIVQEPVIQQPRPEEKQFNKIHFVNWINMELMPISNKHSSVYIFCEGLLKNAKNAQIIDVAQNADIEYTIKFAMSVISNFTDITTLFGVGKTNKAWLKELSTRFMPHDYNGIVDFTPSNIKSLLSYTMAHIYIILTTGKAVFQLPYMIALYISIITTLDMNHYEITMEHPDIIEKYILTTEKYKPFESVDFTMVQLLQYLA